MALKRILYIESNVDGTIGGSYYSLLYLIQGLNKAKYEPVVLFCEEHPLLEKYERAAQRVIIQNYGPTSSPPENTITDVLKIIPRFYKYVIKKQKIIKEIIKSVSPDLIHLNNGYDINHDWILAGKLNGIKVVTHDRGTRPPVSIQTRMFVRWLDAIISVSDDYLNNVIKNNLKPKIARRVYNGLDPYMVIKSMSNHDRNIMRNNLGIKDNETLIGMIGNITPWKGQHIFLAAINIILEKYNNVKVIVVGKTARGDEQYENDLKQFIKANSMSDKVCLMGFRKDVPELLNAIDIFVHSSIEPEPFGRVILEAMALGKPIVATNFGGTIEQIVHGESGILVPPNDHRKMAEGIEGLLIDQKKAKTLGENALLRLKDKFSIRNMVDGVEKIYSEIFSIGNSN